MKNGSYKADNCEYKHQIPDGWKDRSQSRGRREWSQSRRRTDSLSRLESPGSANSTSRAAVTEARIASSCTPANLVPRLPPTQKGVRGEARTKARRTERIGVERTVRNPGLALGARRGQAIAKCSKGGKGSGKGKGSSASTAAAVCLLGAMLAGATPQADAFTFRKELSCQNSMCHSMTSLALPDETPDYINVPIRDPACNFSAIREPERRYKISSTLLTSDPNRPMIASKMPVLWPGCESYS